MNSQSHRRGGGSIGRRCGASYRRGELEPERVCNCIYASVTALYSPSIILATITVQHFQPPLLDAYYNKKSFFCNSIILAC